jgi:chloramphenicol-sensitive protein RarD
MENRKHYAAGILAFVIWGFFSIPLRALQEYSAGEILYFRILFSLLAQGIIIFGFRRKALSEEVKKFSSLEIRDRKKAIFLTLIGAVLLTVNWLIFIYIVNNVNVKTASFAYLVCPVMTAVLGYVLLQEKLSPIQWLAVGLCAVSCALVGLSSWVELGFSFFTALTYALYLISQRKNQGFDRIIILGIQVLFSFTILSTGIQFLVTEAPAASGFYVYIIIIAVIFTVLPLFLNLFALNKINSATIGILMYLNPVFNFSVAFLIFNESITAFQLLGYAIIVVALILFNYQNFKKLQTVISTQRA